MGHSAPTVSANSYGDHYADELDHVATNFRDRTQQTSTIWRRRVHAGQRWWLGAGPTGERRQTGHGARTLLQELGYCRLRCERPRGSGKRASRCPAAHQEQPTRHRRRTARGGCPSPSDLSPCSRRPRSWDIRPFHGAMRLSTRRAQHSWQVFGLTGAHRTRWPSLPSRVTSGYPSIDGSRSGIPRRDNPGLPPGSLARRRYLCAARC